MWARELKRVAGLYIAIVVWSRPLWARELKRVCQDGNVRRRRSRPLWARELKHNLTRLYNHLPPGRAPCGRVN